MKLLLTVRNTSFSLEPDGNQHITPAIINKMENILKTINYKYKTYNFFYDKKYRKKVKKEDKIYFNYIKHKARYTYHINCMKEILGRLGNDGFTKDSFALVSKKVSATKRGTQRGVKNPFFGKNTLQKPRAR